MKKLGKYEITGILGKGAMGIVYKALDPDIDRKVAIKTIRFDLISDESESEELIKRFMREAQSAGKLTHPNIITIYDVGREKDMTYIVMQYIEGPSLQKMISSGEKFSTQDVIQLMDRICSALDYAHNNGIVHRDIKPANILMDKEGKPYIVDFGVARIETSTLTEAGTTIGTPSYMSPEQVMGKKVDRRSDIFSLGSILYELLTGRRAFQAQSITTVIYKIINEEPPALAEVKKGLPVGFEHIIGKALAKDPDERYKTCTQLAADLRNLIQISEKTIPITMIKEELPTLEMRKKPKLGPIIAISLAAIILAAAGGAYFLYQKTGKIPFLSSIIKEKRAEESPLPPELEAIIPGSIEDKLNRAEKSFEKEDYTETIRLAEEILAKYPRNETAQEYLDKAKNKIMIAQTLDSGINHYKKRNYEQCKQEMEKILKLDKDHKEAKRYWNLSDRAIYEANSKQEIRQIIESLRKAEEDKELEVILYYIGSSDLRSEKIADAKDIFNYYDDIGSVIDASSISIKFIDRSHAEAKFFNFSTAISKQTGQRTKVFEGEIIWTMEKQGKVWKIIKEDKKEK